MGNLLTLQCLPRKVEKNFAKNLNTFFGVCQNIRISSYVENIFTETPNEKFGVSVNIFSTYEEIDLLSFCSEKVIQKIFGNFLYTVCNLNISKIVIYKESK